MKKATAITLILAFAVVGFATTVRATDPPKDADGVDYVMDTPSRLVIAGALTDGTPTWHRWRPNSYDEIGLNCDLVMPIDYSTEPHFDQYCFNVTDGVPVEFVVDAADFDTVIYIYCDPFDPTAGMDNCVYMDDDDGEGLLSAIVAANGVTLAPGADYWFVICSYSSTIGNYSVQTSDNVVLCGPVPTVETSWGHIKSLSR